MPEITSSEGVNFGPISGADGNPVSSEQEITTLDSPKVRLARGEDVEGL